MTLVEDLLNNIKDEKLEKTQLEDYYTKICEFRGDVAREIGDYKKKRALYISGRGDTSVQDAKYNWEANPDGARLIELESLKSALTDAKDGIKNRIYSKIA